MAKSRWVSTPGFGAEAARRIADQGQRLAEVARELDPFESRTLAWKQALGTRGPRALPGKGARPGGRASTPPGRGQAAHDGA